MTNLPTLNREQMTSIERFIAKIEIAENGCWHWIGARFPNGYGTFWDKRPEDSRANPNYLAHRWSYEFFRGPIPSGLMVDHVCHNIDLTCPTGANCSHRRCVNPDHLRVVTCQENLHDGRYPRRKQLCKYGHPYSEDRRGKMECKTCRTIRNQARYTKNAIA